MKEKKEIFENIKNKENTKDNPLELKNKIEAILFASGKWIDLNEISNLLSEKKEKIRKLLKSLIQDYNKRDSSLKILEQNEVYKLSIREKYAELMQSIVPNAELSKPEIETLAIIAWKQPVLQSHVIDIRSQSAYAHIANLLDKEFIKRKKKGRTYILETTSKFLEYFDLPSSKELKKDLDKIEKEITKTKMIPLEVYSENKINKDVRKKEKNDEKGLIKKKKDYEKEESKKIGELEVYEEGDELTIDNLKEEKDNYFKIDKFNEEGKEGEESNKQKEHEEREKIKQNKENNKKDNNKENFEKQDDKINNKEKERVLPNELEKLIKEDD